MAKKAKSKVGVSKTPPKSEATPLGTKAHARTAKTSEVDKLERGRRLAASYLVRRDGMDEQLAEDIIGGMTPEDVHNLIVEANTTLIENTASGNGDLGGTPALTDEAGEVEADEAEPAEGEDEADVGELPEYTEIEALASEAEFVGWVVQAAEAAKAKNQAEKVYKDTKKKLIKLMLKAKVEGVACIGHRLSLYKGHHLSLNEQKLLEAGVPADKIVKGWKDTPYDDVRIVPPRD